MVTVGGTKASAVTNATINVFAAGVTAGLTAEVPLATFVTTFSTIVGAPATAVTVTVTR